MSTHTPGPWYVNYIGANGYVIRGGHYSQQLGVMFTKRGFVSANEAKNNARIVAAAPELLAQLQYATATLSAEGFDVSAMRAVIAKATEGQS